MNWPVKCPHCDYVADSHDSYGDSKAMLRYHIDVNHGGKS